MGSRRRLNAVLGGSDPLDVWNKRTDPAYKVRKMGDVVKAGGLGIDGDMKNAKVAKDVMPNVDKPISPVGKIRGYVLNFESEEGRHKARVLSAAFGLTDSDADIGYLANALTTALPSGTITREHVPTKWGKKFDVELAITGRNGHVETMATSWQYDHGSDKPRLVTAFLRGKKK